MINIEELSWNSTEEKEHTFPADKSAMFLQAVDGDVEIRVKPESQGGDPWLLAEGKPEGFPNRALAGQKFYFTADDGTKLQIWTEY